MESATPPDRVALAALGLLLVLPFANPIHTAPIPSFWSEWLAALLGLLVIAATLAGCLDYRRPLAVPAIVVLPLGLAAVTAIHGLTGHAAHPRQALLVAAIQLFAAAMMVAGRTLTATVPMRAISPVLAGSLAGGALLQSLVVALQLGGIGIPLIVFLPASGAVPTGSLGQANHLADYLWLGIASLLYLMARSGRLTMAGGVAVVAIAAASALTASRSVMLYAAGLSALALFAWRTSRSTAWRHAALLCLATLPLMLAVGQLASLPAPSAGDASPGLGERLAASGGDRIRSSLYQVAFEEGIKRPILGHGVGASPWITFQRADSWPQGAPPAIAENLHNIELQWLLEYGAPITILAVGLLALWLRRVIRSSADAAWWGLATLSVFAIHSQIEYPLWFAYFLLPVSWLLGALDTGGRGLVLSRGRSGVAVAAVVLGVVTTAGMGRDYRELERIEAAGSDPRQWPQALAASIELDRTSLLAPNALLFVVGAMPPEGAHGEAREALCLQAMRISPRAEIVFKCALVARLAGRAGEAERLVRLAHRLAGK